MKQFRKEQSTQSAGPLRMYDRGRSRTLCVPKTSSVLIGYQNHVTFLDHVHSVLVRPVFFGFAIKSKGRLETENAALRRQLIVLRRKVPGRVRLTNNDRWFLIQLYRWFPSILQVVTVVQPETLVRWHRAGVSTVNCLSSGMRSPSSLLPSTWPSDEDLQVRDGARSCRTTHQTLQPWIYSLSRPLASNCSMPSSSSV